MKVSKDLGDLATGLRIELLVALQRRCMLRGSGFLPVLEGLLNAEQTHRRSRPRAAAIWGSKAGPGLSQRGLS